MTIATSLLDILRDRARYQPDSQAYIFLQNGETESGSLTYEELDRQARATAAQLQSWQGERALLLYSSGLEFITAFFGCLYAGVVAVPVYPPRRNQKLSRLLSIVNDAQASIALTTTSILSDIEKSWSEEAELAQLKWVATDTVEANRGEFVPKSGTRSSLAFLQYTSGSTGTPKGVMVTHGNIIHNQQLIQQAFGHSEQSICVGWLPLFHDMGLIGHVLQPIYVGFPSILMPPLPFLMKPIRWLKAISKYRATTSGGPNFAYDLCVKKVQLEQLANLDLSSWDLAYSGAEPVRAETLEQFSKKFAQCGFNDSAFYPCYGMAETTLFTTGGDKNHLPVIQGVKSGELEQNSVVESEISSPESRVFVGCGRPYMDTMVSIVNPESLTRCGLGQVGEIWVRGESITSGYWNRPEATQETFQAYVADTGDGPFLRTGDLGFLSNGELFVTGRLKDVIIIRGRNYYPQDIELTVENSHPSLRSHCSAAFSVEIEGEERLVVACEVERTYLRKLNTDEVVREIQIAVSTEHELEVYGVVLLKTGSIPKTSSGKIQRRACKQGFLEDSLNVVGQWQKTLEKNPTIIDSNSKLNTQDYSSSVVGSHSKKVAEIEAWLADKIAELLQIEPEKIDLKQPLAIYGLNSVKAVSITAELEEWLGISVTPTIVYDYPSIQALADYLGQTTPLLSTFVSTPQTATEAVAIIGKGCRFPKANNPQAFWSLLRSGDDAITKVPVSRWQSNNGWGGFLEQVDQFDPGFFSISPREASNMDPQQRLLLEVSWEALENAGLAAEKLAGSRGGVFIGISSGDYAKLNGNLANTEAYYGTGNGLSIAANRLSYFLDWHGPSWAVDTACSSSLVAVHQACQSLLQGECNLALAGGVNMMLSPQLTLTFSEAQMLAADGRCKTFDALANGYVRSEGCGVVVLKRLDDAKADGDNIQAIIRGSAVNQDGLTNGLTAPNGKSQQEVIRLALAKAGVKPNQISYVETHGTGTSLGDPIEVNSLKAVLIEERESNQPCWIGSVKTNIGHTEAAAGIAGLIKLVLSLEHGEIPPHLHLKQLNPYIELEKTPIEICTQLQKWSSVEQPRLAGVSAFGFGGTNAHVILEEAPKKVKSQKSKVKSQDDPSRPLHLLTLSAKTEKALTDLVNCYQSHLENDPELAVKDICFTANTGRSHFNQRLAIITSDKQELADRLAQISAGEKPTGVFSGKLPRNNKSPKIACLFTGQGSQYINMGRQLYETQPLFRETLEQCDRFLQHYIEKSILEIIYPEDCQQFNSSLINQTAYTQTSLFAIEYALFQLWQSWGVKPDVVMGHSVGEYVAATIAGVFSLEDGLKLIAHRGRLMQQLPAGGEMVAVMASFEKVNRLIAPYKEKVAIAAINGPQSIVISGEEKAVGTVKEILEAEGIKTKQIQVSHAFHSPLMEPMLGEFEAVANQITYNQPRIPLISNVTGTRADESIATASYWVNHVRQPVKFAHSMETLHQERYKVFLEIGPKPILLGMGRQCLPEDVGAWLPSLRPGQEDWQQMLQSLGELYVRGVKVDWLGFDKDYSRSKVVLPTYPWQRQRYWIETSENESQKAEPSSENKTTTIVDWLNDGNTQQLAQQLEQVGKFSPEQVNLLPEFLEILVKQHQEQLTAATVKDWFYQVQWKPLLDTKPKTGIQPGHWLIFADTTVVGENLAQQLQQQGCECSLVYRGERYQKLGAGSYQLNPTEPQEFEQLIQAIEENSKFPLQKVIHLWSLDAPTPKDLTVTSLGQAQRWGCGTVLHLVKALIKTNSVPQLWLVTRGAQSVQSQTEEVSVAASPLWGMGRVISLEHPQLWGGMVDLDPQTSESETGTLLQLLADNNQLEDHLALRGEQIYIARLVKKSLTASQPVSLESNATYLITGGLGALGLHTASWMIEKGARHLVLTGRKQPSAKVQQTIEELQKAGAQILVLCGDISQQEEVTKILSEIEASLPILRGVIHAAGLLDDGLLQQMSWEQFTRVMAPKVQGAWHLHSLTQNLPLDFFVGFSSMASLLGSPGQGNYAAANAFMDALVHHRRGMGLPGLSINWGPWAQAGMAANLDSRHQGRMVAKGMSPLASEQGLQVLGQLLEQSLPQVGILPVEWSVFLSQFSFGNQIPLLSELVREIKSIEETKSTNTNQHELLQRWESVSEGERYDLLRTHIQREVAKVLGLSDSQLPSFESGFFELGMDSLMAVELRNRITQLLGVTFPSTLTFDFSNIEQLTKYIASQVLHLSTEDDAQKPEQPKVKSVDYEPIAIIGMGCSFPGGATTPEKFWELLQTGSSARSEIPAQRWDIEAYYEPDREAAAKMVTRYGHFIKAVDQFDPGFFGISPLEATAIDPQHRLLLEVSWQALERAGQKVERLSAAPVGVFVGNDGHDYEQLMQEHLQQEPNRSLTIYTGTGNSISSAAGRLAYTFGFTGPTVTLDTACSSSLVAIHQACNSIRLGECQMAIAGGVKLHLTPGGYIFTSQAGMISPDGLCKTFDRSADGYARGEGCGMVVLKRLSQAQADGDQILALIRASAVNQDGPSSGLTVPNGQSQQKLLKQALKQARVEPTEISYLEAHGTGTSLGDPIEVNAAAAVLGQERPPEQPLWIGSVKTNIGHLESAAGVSALIKVVLSMQHQQMPAHLHLQEPNPKIDWQPWLKVPQALTPWVAPKRRLAGVSSFGFTGTNAHVVLEEAPAAIANPTGEYERSVHLLQLSAKNDLALVELAQRYGEHLDAHPEQDLRDICFTANCGRLSHDHRLAVVASNREELQNKLHEFSVGLQGIGMVSGQVSSNQSAKVAMLFTGQGSQYVGMGRQLYQTQPTFKQVVKQCAEILKDYLDKPLLEILYGAEVEENVLAQTAYTQPALFAIEYALAKLWESWGIKPDVVMGHSVGEYVAATVAGVFSLEDGLKLIAHRGRLMQQLPSGGEMVAVMASESKVNQLIAPYTDKVALAAINEPESVVISGAAEAIRTVRDNLEAEGIKTKQLQVSHAFHSPLMEPMLADFEAVANQITYHQPRIPLISNVTGARADESIATASYWVNHVRQPVKFAQSMETLHQEGYELFLEIGPKPILLGMARQCLPSGVGVWLPSLRPGQEDWQLLLQSLAELYVRGVKVDWLGFDRDYFRSKVVLPTYPFQRQRYWVEPPSEPQQPWLLQRLEAMHQNERWAFLITQIQREVATVLPFGSSELPDPTLGFFEMGMDSLLAVELKNRLENSLGTAISSTVVFNHPNIESLAEYLLSDVLNQQLRQDDPDEMSAKQARLEPAQTEPIAIVGMGCRFPGGANDPESFWQILHNGIDTIREVPASRWDIDAYYDSNPETPGKMYMRQGGFLEIGVDQFDAEFFGLAPREAVSMDPQQRLLLEVSWEALENAGVAVDRLAGSQTGVFVGINTADYSQLQMKVRDPNNLNAYAFTGNTASVAAGRLSYLLGLEGPSIAIDTACSSSLVSIHLACQSLRGGECRMALAGGVNLMLSEEGPIILSKMRALAVDGRCKTFDAAADGYGRGEGCALVVLKRFSDAIADSDNILALIRGSAVNHDGRSSGLTVPNGLAQQKVIRAALANAGVKPNQINYVEVHGTGTALGDPIEVEALANVLSEGHSREQPLMLGSLKTNIGHLEAASGVAGLVKVILAMQHKEIPPHLHLKTPNPAISWQDLPLVIPTEPTPWPVNIEQRRLAGINSFGFSGSNVHVVLEEAPEAKLAPQEVERPMHLLTLSAKSEGALTELTERVTSYLKIHESESLSDVCFTLNTGRSHFEHRLAIVTQQQAESLEQLTALAAGKEIEGGVRGIVPRSNKPKVAFLFTGQGSQYLGMGRQLYETQPTFRKALQLCDEILRLYLDVPLLEILYPDDVARSAPSPKLDLTAYTQPALFALEYALFQLWRSWGIEPSAVMGHSVGEYVAACVAGVFNLEDALRLVAYRGKLMQALPSEGEMVAVFADESLVKAAIESSAGLVSIAAINGPKNTVISGEREAVRAVLKKLEALKVDFRHLKVSHAFHSHLMEPMLDAFEQIARSVEYSPPQIRLISNLTGQSIEGGEIAQAEYWCRHIRESVRFSAGMQALHNCGCEVFIEIGPHPVLTGMGRQCLPEEAGVGLPSLRRGHDDWQQLLQSLAELYVRGVRVDWCGFDRDYPRRRLPLPTYPFQRQRYWLESISPSSQTSQPHETFNDWFYQVEWQPKSRESNESHTAAIPATTPGRWLIFADRHNEIGKALADLLAARGESYALVFPGEAYQATDGIHWQLDPAQPEDFQRLLTEIAAIDERPCRGIVHLWGIDVTPIENFVDSWSNDQLQSCGSVLHLVQALSTVKLASLPRLWLVTQDAQPIPQTASLAVTQAPLLGLSRVVAIEHPELWGGQIDLASDDVTQAATCCLEEIWQPDTETEVAFRQGQRYVPRLKRQQADPTSTENLQIQSDGTYFITGGLGGLGLKLAKWLVDRGARHLVLIGRRGASLTACEQINQLQKLGAQIVVAKVDITQHSQVQDILAEIAESLPPLRGIIHLAGVLDDGVLLRQNWERFVKVMAPKIAGAWNLYLLTQDLSLDFFVSFSSIASLLGSPGQGNYSAANAFLDSLAHYRKGQQLPASSINWSPWGETGMAAELGSLGEQRWAAAGVSAISPQQGMEVLGRLLAGSAAQTGVLPVNWSRFFQHFATEVEPTFLSEIARETYSQLGSEPKWKSQQSELLQQLTAAPVKQRQAILTTYIQRDVATVLGRDRSQIIDPQLGFFDMGMDSLMTLELRNRLQVSLGHTLPSTLTFEYPTIEALVGYLIGEVLSLESSSPSDAESQRETDARVEVLTEIEGLSNNELEALIDEELAALINGN